MMTQQDPSVHKPSQHAVIEVLEGRRLLAAAAAPIPSFLGQYVGSLQATGMAPQPLTLSITTQKNRSFSGAFIENQAAIAVFHGSVSKKGPSKFTFHSTNVKPKFNGTATVELNTTDGVLVGLLISHSGKIKVTTTFVGTKQVGASSVAR
jgi:hypothetical protein